jgi:hypothetical protein
MRYLELIRKIESDRLEPNINEISNRDVAENDFSQRWIKCLQAYAERPDNQILLQSVVFETKPVKIDQVGSLIDSFLKGAPPPTSVPST